MRSKIAQKLLDKTSVETKEFVSLYSDIVVRINELIAEKGYSQKELAESIGKNPSEISKWLKGEHNFTLRSIAKLQAQLGEPIICVPKSKKFKSDMGYSLKMTVYSHQIHFNTDQMTVGKPKKGSTAPKVA
ncbi:multiprotein-bridging factor 1 family protein [Cyclobacterium sp. SYSU L10401]|uniref:helix-turn-helix domain-containing protein n=1 Tax=Cyclobacterium sp. SYSU L10401 TaxID=2678657 RepID=UPI0013D8363D|nr:helix-turn-helix transcriptional regulator [Cyclobacterium sp. SYSU L10401]